MSESINGCDCLKGECPGEESAGQFLSERARRDNPSQLCEEVRQKLNEMLNPEELPEISRLHDAYPDACSQNFIGVLQEALQAC